MMATEQGIPAGELDDEDLERELRHLYQTRADTFFGGSGQALERHTERTLELEAEYARRHPDRVAPDALRTREGSRARAGQDP
jgi:predicted GNAT family N-acyltransferase